MAFPRQKESRSRVGALSGEARDTAGSGALYAVSILEQTGAVVNTSSGPLFDATPGAGIEPACSNRRVVAPPRRHCATQAVIDWFRATLPDTRETWAELAERFGELQALPHGLGAHYDRCTSFGDGGKVGHCSNAERRETQGLMLELSGSACAALGDDLESVMRWALDAGKCTRVDLALDDRAGLVTFDRLQYAVDSGALVTRAKDILWQRGQKAATGERLGWTLNVGSRRSDSFLRIYDKQAERIAKGEDVADMPWVRVELEAKGKLADPLAREYLERGGIVASEQIRRRYQFKTPSETITRRERWQDAPWWLDVLGNVEKGGAMVAGEVQDTTIDHMKDIAERQFATTLASIELADPDKFADWLVDLLANGRSRLKPHHLAALAQAQAQAEPAKVAHNGR